jgi:hypothetical protein
MTNTVYVRDMDQPVAPLHGQFIDKSNVFHNVGFPVQLSLGIVLTSAHSIAVLDPRCCSRVHLFKNVYVNLTQSDLRTKLMESFHFFLNSFLSFTETKELFLRIESTVNGSNVDMSEICKKMYFGQIRYRGCLMFNAFCILGLQQWV